MEKHIEKFLNKVSLVFITIATITLLYLSLQTPQTCIPPNTPTTKPHLKFPSSTCDPSLNHPYMDPTKKRLKLWSSKSWLSQVSSFTTFFQSLNLLNNETKVLCVSAGAGHEVMALNNMGVSDVTGVEIVDSLPLVKRADPNNLPFFDGVFDLAFSAHLEEALFPLRIVGEMERTVRNGGVCVVVVEECGGVEVDAIVGLFRKSMFVGAENVTLIGMRMTRIITRVGVSSSS
jgi:SAM-dependent methyltransferase